MKHVIMCGNPADGFVLFGPYDTADEAGEVATHDRFFRDETWWILGLNTLGGETKG